VQAELNWPIILHCLLLSVADGKRENGHTAGFVVGMVDVEKKLGMVTAIKLRDADNERNRDIVSSFC